MWEHPEIVTVRTKMEISRSRHGERQRAASRAALVDAAVRVFERKSPDSTVIGDFIAEAGVARGTFYNHFKDVAEVEMAVAVKLNGELNDAIRAAYREVDDPAERISIAIRHFIRRAIQKPNWGWVVVRISFGGPLGALMRETIRPDLLEGVESKRFLSIDDETGSDIILGIGFAAMRSQLEGRAPVEQIEVAAEAVLRALGVPFDDAAAIAQRPLPLLPGTLGL